MPRYDNHDLYVTRAVQSEFLAGLEALYQELDLVYVDNCWPSGYYHIDEVVEVDGDYALAEDCACCGHCGDHVRYDDAIHNEHLDEHYCNEECLNNAADEHDLLMIEQSHGGPQYVSQTRNEGVLASYCSVNSKGFEATDSAPFLIGFEVEKCDGSVHENCGDTDILTDAISHDWIAVHDGSLCDETGFELVSPAYNPTATDGLYGASAMKSTLLNWEALDADSDGTCGGHITVSHKGLDGPSLAQRLEPLFPVLYGLFPSRVGGEYSRAVRGEHATGTGSKFRAINTLHNRVEFRLFSGVKTGQQLFNRAAMLTEALKLIVDDNGRPLLIDEARHELSSALERDDSPLSVALATMTAGNNEADQVKARQDRIEGFKTWFETGEITATISRYLG